MQKLSNRLLPIEGNDRIVAPQSERMQKLSKSLLPTAGNCRIAATHTSANAEIEQLLATSATKLIDSVRLIVQRNQSRD